MLLPESNLNKEHLKELYIIREIFEKETDFPDNYCQFISEIIARNIDGYELKAGTYMPENQIHAWNYSQQDNLNVDLSLDQFRDYAGNPISIFMPGETPYIEDAKIRANHYEEIRTPQCKEMLNRLEQAVLRELNKYR